MDKFFNYINFFPMPLWVGMMFAPDNEYTKRAGRSSTLFGIAALNYLLALIQAIRAGSDEEDGPKMDFTSLDGIRAGLGTRPGALGAWSHMLALDLFTGAWIYRQSQRLGAPAWIRIPALFFTLMSGPFGLLIFLIWRVAGGGQPEEIGE